MTNALFGFTYIHSSNGGQQNNVEKLPHFLNRSNEINSKDNKIYVQGL